MSQFTRDLLRWHRQFNRREMPWKGEKDPYRVWLSEIILQQTRVEQGRHYYENFVTHFPDIHALAGASEEKVFRLWEGLGYYARCRNLLHTARVISRELNGQFPSSYEAILKLKGIGPYTAAAISSFAFELPFAVVDGNVIRVLARYFGVRSDAQSTKGKKVFEALAAEHLDRSQPGQYNQAIMDFGATVCKPLSPECNACTLRRNCFAFQNGSIDSLPLPKKKVKVTTRWFIFFVCSHKGKFAVRKREGDDIWQNLFEFPILETTRKTIRGDVSRFLSSLPASADYSFKEAGLRRQQLTHQAICARFVTLRLARRKDLGPGWLWVSAERLNQLAFPKIIRDFMGDPAFDSLKF